VAGQQFIETHEPELRVGKEIKEIQQRWKERKREIEE